MADVNAVENVSTENKQALGAPEGVTNKDLSAGESHEGPKAPVVSNTPPQKEATAEEKAAADKAAADKAEEEAKLKLAEEEEAKKKAEEEEAAKKESLKEYPTYDDPAANSVVNLLKKANVTPEEADTFFRAAVESGKLEDIDVTKLAEKVGKDEADLIMIGVKQYYQNNVAATKEVVTAVDSVFGGETQRETLVAWALEREKTDVKFGEELNEYRKMFDGSPTQAKLAAQELLKAYNADPKNKSLTVSITSGDKPGSTGLNLEYLDRATYVKELTVAESKGDKAEVAKLNARRKVSMQQEKAGQR